MKNSRRALIFNQINCIKKLSPYYDLMKYLNSTTQFSKVCTSGIPISVMNYQKVISPSLMAMQQISQAIIPVVNPIYEYADKISGIIRSLEVPHISEEAKERLIEVHKEWGRIGWTLLPNAPIKLFYKYPGNSFDADKIALKYCNKVDMQNLFDELRTQKIKKEELEEALFCYDNRKYKACALILFSIIDAKFIKLQIRDKLNIDKRKVGIGAISKYKKRTEAEKKKLFFSAIAHQNLCRCLMAFFEDTNDFALEPNVVNRNFLGHGMNKRRVRKKDCIQLFLALNNLMIFIR